MEKIRVTIVFRTRRGRTETEAYIYENDEEYYIPRFSLVLLGKRLVNGYQNVEKIIVSKCRTVGDTINDIRIECKELAVIKVR